jgi:SAM-dependent methyltransferase
MDAAVAIKNHQTAFSRMWRIGLVAVGGLAFFWLVVVRVLAKVAGYRRCPYALAWTVDNPLRHWYTDRVLDRTGIQPGECVLELGSGPGAFTVDAARRVGPEGRLVAVDIQPKMIARVRKRVQGAGLTQVEAYVADACHLPLADESIDRAFLITVLPEIPAPVRALVELRRVLKSPEPAEGACPELVEGACPELAEGACPELVEGACPELVEGKLGGALSITEEILSPTYPLARTVVRWAEEVGFELEERYGNWWLYTLNFRKTPSWRGSRPQRAKW